MKPWKRLIAPACVALACLFMLAPSASAQVLQQVPADALVVIKFNNLKATNEKIAAMSNKLGIAQFQPDFGDPLSAFKRELNAQEGIDESGDAAMVILGAPAQRRQPPMLILIPVTDYKAFVANFTGAKAEGELTMVPKMGNNNRPSYIANWGKYAAIAPSKEAVANKPAGIQVAGLAAKELSDKDIVAYVNMKAAREKILPALAEGRQEFIRNFERGYQRGVGAQAAPRRPGAGAAPPPAAEANGANAQAMKYLPIMRALFNRAFDTAEQMVNDADAATWGIAITDDGIRVTGLAEFTGGSTSAKHVSSFKAGEATALTGLPQTKYLMFGSMRSGGELVELLNAFVAPIEKEAAALGADGKPIQDYIAAMRRGTQATTASTFGLVMPTGALGQEAIMQIVSLSTGDAKAMLQSQREIFQTQQAFMDMFSPPNLRGQMKITFQENAKTVDGVQFHQIQQSFAPPAAGQRQDPQLMQMQQMMNWMYGPGGLTANIGAIGADKMVVAMGVSDQMIQQLVAAAKANQDLLSQQPTVQAVSKQLPQNKIAVAYIAIDNIATTVANYAKMFGMPINFQLPPNLEPIGMSLSTEGSAIRGDYYIPAQTVQSVVAGVIQTYMEMQGGMQPGGPGGL